MERKNLNILLVCNLGASTGVMVAKMRTVAEASEKLKKFNVKIDARPAGDLGEYVEDYNCVLVGPQMKHRFSDIECECKKHGKPCEIIPSDIYGMADGTKILKQAIYMVVNNK